MKRTRRAGPTEAQRERWTEGADELCASCGDLAQELHHVVYAQHVRAAGGDVFDPSNALDLCRQCHGRHHDGSSWRLPYSLLTDANLQFAERLLGTAVLYYFQRRYGGLLSGCFEGLPLRSRQGRCAAETTTTREQR